MEPTLEQRPAWAEGHATLALTYVEEERWQTACKHFERSLELDPELHKVRVPYGWCLYYLGQLERARASFRTYLEHEPDYPDAVAFAKRAPVNCDAPNAPQRALGAMATTGLASGRTAASPVALPRTPVMTKGLASEISL